MMNLLIFLHNQERALVVFTSLDDSSEFWVVLVVEAFECICLIFALVMEI